VKLNELKKTNLYENAMDDRIRDRAKTDFVNNVVSFLSNSLDQAIRSGQVSVNSANGASGQADNAPPETPTTPTTPDTPAQAAEKRKNILGAVRFLKNPSDFGKSIGISVPLGEKKYGRSFFVFCEKM
jgi:hypothetical protein